MITITVANQKGGVGKTTTAVHLAMGLTFGKSSVLLIDLDPQGQCATFLGKPQAPGVYDMIIKELPITYLTNRVTPLLQLLQSDYKTGNVNSMLPILNRSIDDLKHRLRKSGFDYIIIDTAPSVSSLQTQAIYASDYILVPTACDFASTQGVTMLETTLQFVSASYNWPGQLLGILPTYYDEVTQETQTVIKELSSLYPNSLLQPIHRATVLRECSAAGQTVYEYSPSARAAIEYTRLVQQVRDLAK